MVIWLMAAHPVYKARKMNSGPRMNCRICGKRIKRGTLCKSCQEKQKLTENSGRSS